MADQQFLASFGVDIDESGVSRLQKILAENRTLAESLSASFDAASESVKAFRESISEDFPTLFSGSGYGNVTENLFGEYAGQEGDRGVYGEREETDPALGERLLDRVRRQDGDGKRPEPVLRNFYPECPGGNEYGPEVRRAFLPAGQPESG